MAKKSDAEKHNIMVRLPPEMGEAFREEAFVRRLPVAVLARQLIEAFLQEGGDETAGSGVGAKKARTRLKSVPGGSDEPVTEEVTRAFKRTLAIVAVVLGTGLASGEEGSRVSSETASNTPDTPTRRRAQAA